MDNLVKMIRERRTELADVERRFAHDRFSELNNYRDEVLRLEELLATEEANLLQTGMAGTLQAIYAYDNQRTVALKALEGYLSQLRLLDKQIDDIAFIGESAGSNQAAAFKANLLDPIEKAIREGPMRSVDRDAWLQMYGQRVETLNRFIDQMKVVDRMQRSIANVPGFENLADEFVALQDIAIPEATRLTLLRNVQAFIAQSKAVEDLQQSVLNVPGFETLADEFATLQDFDVPESARLNLQRIVQSYIAQIKQFQAAQRDVSIGAGADPLAVRFKTERLDAIEQKLRDINTTEAERGQLIAQYRMEQEKILAIQQKQQQLTFLQEQLSLLEKLRGLDDEEGYGINVENILGGIKFGIGASMDDLLALTGRTIDELVKFTNWKLGIHSPSKVFAEIGQFMMQGLGQGIERMAMMPMRSMAQAVSNVAQPALTSRSFTMNVGSQHFSSEMDSIMFEARVKQLINSSL